MKRVHRPLIAREGSVLAWELHIYARADGSKQHRERKSSLYLVLQGEFSEPVKGISLYSLQLMSTAEPDVGNREMPCVGSILRVKPRIDAGGTLTKEEFEALLTLATTGNLRHMGMIFEEPRYGSALIASMSFFSQPPTEEYESTTLAHA